MRNQVIPLDFQDESADKLVSILQTKPSALLIDPVGYGKTYTVCMALKKLHASGFFDARLWPVVWVTKAAVVPQTQQIIKDFGLETLVPLVTNYDKLRSNFGKLFIKFKSVVSNGQEELVIKWSPKILPRVFVLDEPQAIRHQNSLQTKVFQSLIDLFDHPNFKDVAIGPCSLIFSSATPFTRVSEAKTFCTSTKMPLVAGSGLTVPLNSEHWGVLVSKVCRFTDPEAYCTAAMERLMDVLKDYIVRSNYHSVQKSFTKLGRKLHKAIFKTLIVKPDSDTYSKYLQAQESLQDWLREHDDDSSLRKVSRIQEFVRTVEVLRAPIMAKLIHDTVSQGRSAACAVNYKQTLINSVIELVLNYDVHPENISLIWGGANKDCINSDDLAEIYKVLRLDKSSYKFRQSSIKDFQSDTTKYCFYTFKAGGVGISLHQATQSMRPRTLFLGPTYSAIDLAQGCGRVPRITSWSDTPVNMVMLAGTPEEHVAQVVNNKMKCLSRATASRESWYSLLAPQHLQDFDDYCREEQDKQQDLAEALEGCNLEEHAFEVV